MIKPLTRRHFLQAAAAGSTAIGLGDLSFLTGLPRVSAAEARPNIVQLQREVEPLVRLLEETPRDKLLEEVAGRIRGGTTYREVLAALLLAGVRNIQPRPVGFKFHAVLVVNSAHLASIASPEEHRWLPIFWALDEFKNSQAADVREGDWTMAGVDESAVPTADQAQQAFVAAMDNWDVAAADVAAAALARSMKPADVFELFFRYGCRDFRSIGHKAIFVVNSMRTLDCIGWQHAEPVLRSLAYALLSADGAKNPAREDLPADRPGRRNRELATKIRAEWREGKPDDAAMLDMLAALRQANSDETSDKVVELLNRGVAPQSVYDALHLGAGELLMRQPGIVALHAVTSTNALRFAFETTADDETRRLLLLQNAAFLALFREAMNSRGKVGDARVDELAPASAGDASAGAGSASAATSIAEMFADVTKDRTAAARKILSYAEEHPEPKELIDAARLLVFLKGRDSHDYKYSSALFEDYYHVSPQWRARYLATGAFNLRGSGAPDNKLVERTRAALKG